MVQPTPEQTELINKLHNLIAGIVLGDKPYSIEVRRKTRVLYPEGKEPQIEDRGLILIIEEGEKELGVTKRPKVETTAYVTSETTTKLEWKESSVRKGTEES